jgi:hypothetical protein
VRGRGEGHATYALPTRRAEASCCGRQSAPRNPSPCRGHVSRRCRGARAEADADAGVRPEVMRRPGSRARPDPPPTRGYRLERGRRRGTPVNGVPRHRTRAGDGNRTRTVSLEGNCSRGVYRLVRAMSALGRASGVPFRWEAHRAVETLFRVNRRMARVSRGGSGARASRERRSGGRALRPCAARCSSAS